MKWFHDGRSHIPAALNLCEKQNKCKYTQLFQYLENGKQNCILLWKNPSNVSVYKLSSYLNVILAKK